MSKKWLLPPQYYEAAVELLGDRSFTLPSLDEPWSGKVFLAPPDGKIRNKSIHGLYAQKMVDEYAAGNIEEGIILVCLNTGYKWFAPLRELPRVMLDHLIRFTDPTTNKPYKNKSKQSRGFFYVGENVDQFYQIFKRFGPYGQFSYLGREDAPTYNFQIKCKVA